MKLKFMVPFLLLVLILSACTQPGAAVTMNTDANNNLNGTNSVTDGRLITEAEAQDIALKHAGFSADQVNRLRVGFEYDDGIPEYTVEFWQGTLEYEYEIHGKTGQILSFERDD